MKKELNPTTVWLVIGAVVVIAALAIIFGAFKPKLGKGPEVEAKPWRPSRYTGAPQDQGGTAPAPYHAPGQGAMGAPSAPPSGNK